MNVKFVRTIAATTLLLTPSAVLAQAPLLEIGTKILIQETGKRAADKELEERRQNNRKAMKDKKEEEDLYLKATEFDQTLGISIGPTYTLVRKPSQDFDARTGVFANLHFERQGRLLFFPMPWLSTGVNLNYSTFNGFANYRYKNDSGFQFSGVHPYRAYSTALESTFRFRPLAGLSIQPFAEFGLSLGGTSLQFAGSAKAPLNAQGADAKLSEIVFMFGYFASAGIEWDYAGRWGVALSFRHGDARGSSRLLDSELAFKTDSVLTTMYVRF